MILKVHPSPLIPYSPLSRIFDLIISSIPSKVGADSSRSKSIEGSEAVATDQIFSSQENFVGIPADKVPLVSSARF
jgi:hypothetical protein